MTKATQLQGIGDGAASLVWQCWTVSADRSESLKHPPISTITKAQADLSGSPSNCGKPDYCESSLNIMK